MISQDDLDSLFDSFVADDMDDAFDKPAVFDNSAAAVDSDALKREEDDRAQQAAIDQAWQKQKICSRCRHKTISMICSRPTAHHCLMS
ncbi:hypothetical protein JCM19237_3186 [Photobacterium aphoticum]|uniref:Uncharacterized protein n=1 Tax=Photobacterium aphoticum TaxID=754436 RepID=A0A090RMI1_9GAMM|nr:hypothetical protein JCM19237_3186 [Photobacterium aphoticum]